MKEREAEMAESMRVMNEITRKINANIGEAGLNKKLEYLTEFLSESAKISDRATKENLNLQIKVLDLTDKMHTLTRWGILLGIIQVLAVFIPFFKWFFTSLFSVVCRILG